LRPRKAIALEAIDAGADVIELGVPFSDPLGMGR
jgi:tryptophan synthase alpha subunit